MGLFCTKKPPKAEDQSNVINYFYDPEKQQSKYVLEISSDDKVYICPYTSTGMRGARNEKIFQPVDEVKAKKLPKYDFPVAMVNVTP